MTSDPGDLPLSIPWHKSKDPSDHAVLFHLWTGEEIGGHGVSGRGGSKQMMKWHGSVPPRRVALRSMDGFQSPKNDQHF